MTKSKFLFTAILAIMISAGAWAYAPGDTTADGSTAVGTDAHDVYVDAPTDGEAGAGIAGVTYVNRVANRAGAAAQAAEDHAAHASKSASAAQSSADAAAGAASAASDAAADAASAAEVAKNITAGDGIVVTDKKDDNNNVIGKEIAVNPGEGIKTADDGTVAVKPATKTELGGLFAPASLADAQKSLEEIDSRGKDIFDPDNQALIAVTYPLAVELAAQGQLSGAYPTIADANADFNANKEDTMKLRPLSAWALLEGQLAERADISAKAKVSYVNMPSGKESDLADHTVGDAARPVYVADAVTDGKHSGVVTPIESVAVPVGDDNFTDAQSTAKIWIQ